MRGIDAEVRQAGLGSVDSTLAFRFGLIADGAQDVGAISLGHQRKKETR
jgi:hypothetical protein